MLTSVQICANALFTGAAVALASVGFHVIYRAQRAFDFSYALSIVAGAYASYWLMHGCMLSAWFSVPFGLSICYALGCMCHKLFYIPWQSRGRNSNAYILLSLGLYVIGVNIIAVCFGDNSLRLGNTTVVTYALGCNLTHVQLLLMATATGIGIFYVTVARYSRFGVCLRAIDSDRQLAEIVGIDVPRVGAIAVGSGWLIGAVVGLLTAADVGLKPAMGMRPMLLAVVAVASNGPRSERALILIAVLLGGSIEFVGFFLGAQWQDALAVTALFCALLICDLTTGDQR